MRNGIQDFSLANSIYAGATVTFYTVSGGIKTTTKATLYADTTSTSTLSNPQYLDADGKFVQPVYVDVAVVATISGLSIADHDTGIIQNILASPVVAGNPLDMVRVNSAGTALETKTAAQIGLEEVSHKDATGGYAGLTLLKINFKNTLNTFTSFFTNSNTAPRTYTFQDRDGTVADNTDLAAKASLSGATFTGLTNFAAGANIASATTIDLSTATGNCPRITGIVPTSAVTMNTGQWELVTADGAWPLTYHPTTNKLSGGVNYTCKAGDLVLLHKDLSGVVHGTIFPASGVAARPYFHIREELAAGTNGGTFTSGSFVKRALNTKTTDTHSLVTLASNQITFLVAGTYRIRARAPAIGVEYHTLRLRNTTTATTLISGSSAYALSAGGNFSDAVLSGDITVAANDVIELQHACSLTQIVGLGLASNLGAVEVYSEIEGELIS